MEEGAGVFGIYGERWPLHGKPLWLSDSVRRPPKWFASGNFSRSWTSDADAGRFPGSRFLAAGLPSRSLTSGFVDPVLTAYSCGYSQGCAVARLVPFLTPNGAGTEANAQGSVGESQAGFQAQNTLVGWAVPSVA